MLKRFKGTKGMILLMIIVLLIVGYYYYLSHREIPQKEDAPSNVMTPVQEVLARNLDTNYPQTPREVVKYFSEITKCFYNEELTEEDITALGKQIRKLYDDELVANQTEETYLEQLKSDILANHASEQTMISYTPSSSVDVESFSQDGYEWARLYCIYGIKQGILYNSNTVFVLRKDKEKHYKIFGWQLVPAEEEENQE